MYTPTFILSQEQTGNDYWQQQWEQTVKQATDLNATLPALGLLATVVVFFIFFLPRIDSGGGPQAVFAFYAPAVGLFAAYLTYTVERIYQFGWIVGLAVLTGSAAIAIASGIADRREAAELAPGSA